MKLNIKKEYLNADFSNIETLKQIVINKFTENGLIIQKIRQGKKDGIFVYHKYGMEHNRKIKEKTSEDNYPVTYRRYNKKYNVSFISTENVDDFEIYLHMAICEAKIRSG